MSRKGSTALIVLLVVAVLIFIGVFAWWQLSEPTAPAPIQHVKKAPPVGVTEPGPAPIP